MIILLESSCYRSCYGNIAEPRPVSFDTVTKALQELFPGVKIGGEMTKGASLIHLTMPVPEQISVSAIRKIPGLFLLQPKDAGESRRIKEALVA